MAGDVNLLAVQFSGRDPDAAGMAAPERPEALPDAAAAEDHAKSVAAVAALEADADEDAEDGADEADFALASEKNKSGADPAGRDGGNGCAAGPS